MLKVGDRVLLFKNGKFSTRLMQLYVGDIFTIKEFLTKERYCRFVDTIPFAFDTEAMIKIDDLCNISPEEFMKKYKESIDN